MLKLFTIVFFGKVKRNEDNTFTYGFETQNNGENTCGTPMGMFDDGRTMIEWFNRIRYDAVVPGRYDFISGAANLNDLINIADFPFLGANLKCNDCPLISNNFKPYIIQEIQGIKIGILGIIYSGIPDLVLSENLQGVEVLHEKPSLEKWIPIVKQQGAEIVIVLTSSGIPWDREDVYKNFVYKSDISTNGDDSSLTHPFVSLLIKDEIFL